MDGLAMGALCALAFRDEQWRTRCKRWLAPVACCAAAVVALIRIAEGEQSGDWILMQRFGLTLLGILYSCVVLRGAIGSRSGDWVSRAFTFRPLVRLGTVSYGVYVLHYMLGHVVSAGITPLGQRWALPPIAQAILMITFGGLLSYGAAEVSWRLFESRILAYKGRFTYRYADAAKLPDKSRAVTAG